MTLPSAGAVARSGCPTRRHQAGRSSLTLTSRLRNSSTPPAGRGGGAVLSQELDQLRPSDDHRAVDEPSLVKLPPLEAGGADVHLAPSLDEVRHQLPERGEPLLA